MSLRPYPKPSPADLEAARDGRVPDVIAPGLRVLFCGINPSLYSAAVGHHFAGPSNRFWPALHAAGFTERRLAAWESDLLLDAGYGITNVVERATTAAAELSREEYEAGGERLASQVEAFRPRWLAVLGLGAYRTAFDSPKATVGPQAKRLGPTRVWVLPNPSGLNAHYPPARLAEVFRALRLAAGG